MGATVAIGLAAGLAAVAFHEAMILLGRALVEGPSSWRTGVFVTFVMASMGAAAWITGWLMKRFAPDASGSGIPQVKVAYREGRPNFLWHLIWSNSWEELSRLVRDPALAGKVRRLIKERPSPARLRSSLAKR